MPEDPYPDLLGALAAAQHDGPEGGPVVELKVATWNVERKAEPEMLDLLRALAPDVLFLQEVTKDTWPIYRDQLDWSGHAFGLDYRPRKDGEGRGRALGAAMFVRAPLVLAGARVLTEPDIARPERVLVASVDVGGGVAPVTVVSYHALQGRQGVDEHDKPRTSMVLGEWLGRQTGPVLIGMDANSPDVDHPTEAEMECCFAEPEERHMERRLLGPDRVHPLSDVWRTFLTEHPGQMRRLAKALPSGPLAVTHFIGTGPVQLPKRYDHIWATKDFSVLDVRHDRRGFQAGSDHALVVARLGF